MADPVGAISVHLVNGIWGTLAVGLFAQEAIAPGTTGNGLFFGGGGALLKAQIIGDRLKEIREREGISLNDIARKVGVSKRMIQKYESGESEVSVNKALKEVEND